MAKHDVKIGRASYFPITSGPNKGRWGVDNGRGFAAVFATREEAEERAKYWARDFIVLLLPRGTATAEDPRVVLNDAEGKWLASLKMEEAKALIKDLQRCVRNVG